MDAAEKKAGQGNDTRRTSMGRKRIRVQLIPDERNRQVTFMKRKNGLLKKAMELSILCDCEIALVVLNNGTKKLVEYSSSKIDTVLSRFQRHRNLPHETHGNEDLYRQYFTDDTSFCLDGNADSSEKNLVQDKQRSTPPPSWCSSQGASGATTSMPLSPGSETAHAHIDVAFDVLLHKIVSKHQQAKGTGKLDGFGSQAVRGISSDSREKRQRVEDHRVNVGDNGSAIQSVGNVPLDPRKFLDDLKKEATGQVPTASRPLSSSATFSQPQVHQSQRPYKVSLPSGVRPRGDPFLGGEIYPARPTRQQDLAQSFQMTGELSPDSMDTMDFESEKVIKRENPAMGDVEEYVLVNTNDGIMAVPVVQPELLPLSGVDLPRMEAVQGPNLLKSQGQFHQDNNGRISDVPRMMTERGCQQNPLLKPPALEKGSHEPPCDPALHHQGISSSMLLPFPTNQVTKCMPEPQRMDPNELANLRSLLIQRALLATREDEKAKDQVLSLDDSSNVPQEIAIPPDQIERGEVWDGAGNNGLGSGEDGGGQEDQVDVSGCQIMPLNRALQLQKALLEKH